MAYVDFSLIAGRQVPKPFERELKTIMTPETHEDVNNFSLLVSTLVPRGGCTDFHAHEKSGELMIFTSGKGKAWLEGVEYELKPGVALFAPPGKIHKTMNTGDEPLTIICVFVPPFDPDYISDAIQKATPEEAREILGIKKR